jgi:hypothetical protein
MATGRHLPSLKDLNAFAKLAAHRTQINIVVEKLCSLIKENVHEVQSIILCFYLNTIWALGRICMCGKHRS